LFVLKTILLQEIDLRIGASFTRFQTMLLKDAFIIDFGEERNLVLSYGPCQVSPRQKIKQMMNILLFP
jgi:DNA topoisomerase III